ncbi:anti-sigma factor domain-containing protein [Pseudoduganella sp. UC29_106]|uniref:anti-sigma factor n=1 Tax=Pseudoduganella sp. UC29_106 TaxID=3374553 RepID=UPI0037574961
MNIRGNEALRERLAAEYVLGTLRGGARRRFEGWMFHDAALRRMVAEWQERLVPMAELAPAVAPPPGVWRDIAHRLHLDAAEQAPAAARWWDSLRWWRGLGLASAAIAALLVATIGVRTLQAPSVDMVATLTDAQSQPALVVTADARRQVMEVKVVGGPPVPPDKALQLWAIPKQGNPRSLGVLGTARQATLTLNERAAGSDVVVLAISLEQRGGSPDPNGPTGPVLYKGPWVRM